MLRQAQHDILLFLRLRLGSESHFSLHIVEEIDYSEYFKRTNH